MPSFLGVDLGWYGKPTGLAALSLEGAELRLTEVDRISEAAAILDWIAARATGDTVAGVDAPLVIPNATGIRAGERELNREFRRYDAGCHPANLGRPFAGSVTAFSRNLEQLGFAHGAAIEPRQPGRFQIEVHPHAATVQLFGLDRIVKYKRGLRADRARGLARLRRLIATGLSGGEPRLAAPVLPSLPRRGNLKPAEDRIDAVLCAYVAAHWWYWGRARNSVYGNDREGYIVVPHRRE